MVLTPHSLFISYFSPQRPLIVLLSRPSFPFPHLLRLQIFFVPRGLAKACLAAIFSVTSVFFFSRAVPLDIFPLLPGQVNTPEVESKENQVPMKIHSSSPYFDPALSRNAGLLSPCRAGGVLRLPPPPPPIPQLPDFSTTGLSSLTGVLHILPGPFLENVHPFQTLDRRLRYPATASNSSHVPNLSLNTLSL